MPDPSQRDNMPNPHRDEMREKLHAAFLTEQNAIAEAKLAAISGAPSVPRDDTTPTPFIDVQGLRAKALRARSSVLPWEQRSKLAAMCRSDGDFIAAFSPDVVLYLLNEYETGRASLVEARRDSRTHEPNCSAHPDNAMCVCEEIRGDYFVCENHRCVNRDESCCDDAIQVDPDDVWRADEKGEG